MKCPKCGSESYRIRNYDPYTNKLIYECDHCGSVMDCFNDETIYTNKSITDNKQYTVTTNKSFRNSIKARIIKGENKL